MVKCPEITAAEVSKMKAEGINPTLDELTMLILTGRIVENPKAPVIPSVGVPPVAVCDGVVLWPATLQGEFWHAYASTLWTSTADVVKGFAYSLCHGRIPSHFDGLYDDRAARAAVKRWAGSLSVTLEELSACIIAVSPESFVDVPGDDNAKRSEWSEILCDLVAMTGIPVEHWLNNSSDYALAVLERSYKVRVMAAGGTWKESNGNQQAMMEFMAACQKVRENHGQ